MTQKLAHWPFHFICRFFLNLEIKGEENCQSLSGPLIIAANHKNYLDGIILVSALPRNSGLFPIRFIVKRAIYFTPILHFLLWITGGIPLKKGLSLEQKLSKALEVLRNKSVIAIFPEGRRVFSKELGHGRRGAAFLALKTRVPILPIGISGILGTNSLNFLFRKKRIVVSIGASFFLPSVLSSDNNDDLLKGSQIIMNKIKEVYYED